jgi:hypothetical protein
MCADSRRKTNQKRLSPSLSRQTAVLLAINTAFTASLPSFAQPLPSHTPLINYGLPEEANERQNLLIHFFVSPGQTKPQESSSMPETTHQFGYSAVNLDCQLPIHGTLSAPAEASVASNGSSGDSGHAVPTAASVPKHKHHAPRELTATLSSDSYETIDQRMNKLVDCALEKNPQMAKLDKAVAHFRTKTQKSVAVTKDLAEYVFDYQGFGPSSEAGDIVLGEKLKIKSRSAAEYARQQLVDSTHTSVTSGTMELAMGLGMADKTRGGEIANSGYENLKTMVGEEEASKTKELIVTLCQDVNIPDTVYNKNIWSTSERQKKQDLLLSKAIANDSVLQEITKCVHKYNKHSKVSSTASHLLQPALSLAAIAPLYIGPAAVVALIAFVGATGGSEQNKIMKELYLDKRIQSRTKVLSEDIHMALDNYELGMVTHNPALIACAQSMIGQLVGVDVAEEVLGQAVLSQALTAKNSEIASSSTISIEKKLTTSGN